VTRPRIAVVVSGFPRLSETFALNELLALDALGALGAVFATKPGDPGAAQPGAELLLPRVEVLPDTGPAGQAEALVRRLGRRAVAAVHGYFAHTPADVARRAAEMLGVPYGFSVHARDARKVAPDELADRARHAACVVACNPDVATELDGAGARVHLVPHGVDAGRFRPSPFPPGPLQILAAGRLVEKKGFHVLIDAAARLDAPFHLRIVGDGPERGRLAAAIEAAGLSSRVTLDGARTHAELPADYAAAHVVVAPSVEDRSGDRDGLPNVVLEAMASGRPVVASDVGAIASAVTHRETGLLVPPGDAGALASALRELAGRLALREALGREARARVVRDYDVAQCTGRLHRLLEVAYA
jgi:glycosyltransferase involved in cell wall biosynthesis